MLGLACVLYISFVGLSGLGVWAWGLKRQPRPSLAKWVVLTLSPLVLGALVCGLPLYVPRWINDYRLHRFAQNLYAYPLPPQTVVIGQHSEVRLMGNSNHCDFLAEQTLVSQLTRPEIEAYYAEVQLPPAREDSQQDSLPVYLNFIEPESEATGLKFVLRLFDYDNPTDFDFRCH